MIIKGNPLPGMPWEKKPSGIEFTKRTNIL